MVMSSGVSEDLLMAVSGLGQPVMEPGTEQQCSITLNPALLKQQHASYFNNWSGVQNTWGEQDCVLVNLGHEGVGCATKPSC